LANLVLGVGPAHHLVAPGHSEVTITIRGIGGPLAIKTIAVADGGGVKVSRGSVAETKSNAIRRLGLPLADAIAMSMAGETIRIGSRANRAIAIAMSRVNLGKAHGSDGGTSDSIAIRRLGISRPLANTIADAVSDGGGVQISTSPGTVANSITVRRLSISRPLANTIADAVSDGGGVQISTSPGTVANSISVRRLSISRPLANAIADAVSDGGGVEISSSPGTVANSISIRRLSISRPLANAIADAISDGGGVEVSRSPVAESIAIRRLSLPLAIAAIANAIVESLGATVREADSGVGVQTDTIAVRSIGGPLADSVSVSVASIAAVSKTKTLDAPLGAAHPGGVKSHSVADRRLSLPLAVSLGGPRLGVDSAIRVVRESSQSNTTVQTDSIRGLSLPLAVSSVSIPKSIPD